MTRFSSRSALDVLTSVVLIGAATTLIYKNVFATRDGRESIQVPTEPLSIAGAPTRGSADAKVVMIVYSDFECPFCRRFAREVLPEIERRYMANGSVSIAFRHLPLPIHKHAASAAWNAECAAKQGRFWEMHDAIFAAGRLDENSLSTISKAMSLDMAKFNECLADEAVASNVKKSAKEASALGVRATPTFFIGVPVGKGVVKVSTVVSGALPADELARELNLILHNTRRGWLSWLPFVG
jgi:protein-disulfide isomerase